MSATRKVAIEGVKVAATVTRISDRRLARSQFDSLLLPAKLSARVATTVGPEKLGVTAKRDGRRAVRSPKSSRLESKPAKASQPVRQSLTRSLRRFFFGSASGPLLLPCAAPVLPRSLAHCADCPPACLPRSPRSVDFNSSLRRLVYSS